MAILLMLIGAHELDSFFRGRAEERRATALCLGVGLVLGGLSQVLGSETNAGVLLEHVAWPFLVAGIVCAYRDGSLARTFSCARTAKRADGGRATALRSRSRACRARDLPRSAARHS